jgi:hypothetical protein
MFSLVFCKRRVSSVKLPWNAKTTGARRIKQLKIKKSDYKVSTRFRNKK